MKPEHKQARYERIYSQLEALFEPVPSLHARMATLVALLHHKFDYFFWTGFYMLEAGELLVASYQGPLACMRLKKDVGVCWHAINTGASVVVEDVEEFPGHIACSSLSRSEIVIPLISEAGQVLGCLDVDSRNLAAFDEHDRLGLERLVELIKK